MEPVRLTQFSHGAGCGCKLAPGVLHGVVERLAATRGTRPEALLVGNAGGDDAAVWRLDDERALVATTDFFTPVVDDARTWGRIAATNAVSDVYAMGGTPLFALNIVAWNSTDLPAEMLGDVLAGGQDVAEAAGFAIVGGHTIDDPEPKYGLAVTGIVHPARILTNDGLRAGQDVVLTKPLGVGVVTTAIKTGRASDELAAAAVTVMTRLNDDAARIALAAGATGCTDVTGFGLTGHLGRMARESGVRVTIDVSALPVLAGVRQLVADGVVPGGTRRNLEWARPFTDVGTSDDVDQLVVADAQTSGGLVFGVDRHHTAAVLAELAATGHDAAHIGVAAAGAPGLVLR
jgi:selenide,water dikinase